MINAKTFIKAFEFFGPAQKDLKLYLTDKRLTGVEKKIIEACIMLKESKNLEAIDHIIDQASSDQVVVSYKHFVLGWAYTGIGTISEARANYKLALEYIRPYNLKNYEYLINYYLFFACLNQKDTAEVKKMAAYFDDYIPENVKESGCRLRCLFCYFSYIEDFEQAEKLLKKLEKLDVELHPSAQLNILIDKFILYIKKENFQACEKTLEEIKKIRNYRHKSNFKFMKTLLEHLMYDKVIYAYESDYEEIPLLHWQIQVIKHLEEGNSSEAHFYWSKLSEFEPRVYCSDFNYQGDKCLFSICLKKHIESKDDFEDIKNLPENKIEALIMILSHSSAPLRQEWIYEKIWKEPSPSKTVLNNRLASMVARIRKEKHLDIVYKKGCYQMQNKALKKSS